MIDDWFVRPQGVNIRTAKCVGHVTYLIIKLYENEKKQQQLLSFCIEKLLKGVFFHIPSRKSSFDQNGKYLNIKEFCPDENACERTDLLCVGINMYMD